MQGDEYIRPPGCYYDILQHPSGANRAVEVAVVQDHRFAFFFWLKWKNRLGTNHAPPALVSLDWHEDLTAPAESECEDLQVLDQHDYREAAFFCWDKLNPLNDGHILAAAFLDLVGDIFVVRKQHGTNSESFYDSSGKPHYIHCFDSIGDLLSSNALRAQNSVFFDIDLDYFTESPEPCGGGKNVTLVSAEDIAQALHPNGELLSWIHPRLEGMTIATEPEFCGGFINSNNLFATVTGALFEPPLLSKSAAWVKASGA